VSKEPLDDFVRAMLEANQKNKAEAERQLQEQRVRNASRICSSSSKPSVSSIS